MTAKSLIQATRQLPCSVVLLSAAAEGQRGVMTASAMYVSEAPPLVAVSIAKTDATHQLVEESGEFAVNIVQEGQIDLVRQAGASHGHDFDKFTEFNIPTEPAEVIKAPLVAGCAANLECRVVTSLWDVRGNHAIYIGEVVAFRADPAADPMVWLGNRYFKVGTECRL